MGLYAVPNLLNQSPSDRYEERMNDLLAWADENWATYDQRALRLLLSAAFIHCFTEDAPVWIWANMMPPEFETALGQALGKVWWAPPAGKVALELSKQTTTEKSLWVFQRHDAMFHRTLPEIETSLRQLVDVERGEHEWHPRGIALDGRQGPAESFVWTGRVTLVATVRPLDALQAERCGKTWPIAQNSFVNLRMGGKKSIVPQSVRSPYSESVRQLRVMILNLMDFDFRNRKYAVTGGFPASLTYLAGIVSALRGAGFDSDSVLRKACRLATGHAAMMAKAALDQEDYSLARKVLLDAIPPGAMEILEAIPLDGYWTVKQLSKRARRIPDKIHRVVQALYTSRALLYSDCSDKDGRSRRAQAGDYYAATPELSQCLMGGL